MTVSQCVKCKHWRGGSCAAFPDGVPMAILANEFDHSKRYAKETVLFAPR